MLAQILRDALSSNRADDRGDALNRD